MKFWSHPVNKERIKRKLPQQTSFCVGVLAQSQALVRSEKYSINSACIAASSIIRGVCKVAGMKLINVEKALEQPKPILLAKANAVIQTLKLNDFVVLHVKATDVASHDGNIKQKIGLIEKIDRLLGYMMNKIDLDSTCGCNR